MNRTSRKQKFKAISIFLTATMCFAVLNCFIKLASSEIGPYVIVAYRCGLGALLMFSLIRITPEAKLVRLHRFNFIKGFIDFISIPLWIIAMSHLMIGEVVSISYITPILSTFLAVIFLKEKMSIHKIIALLLGISGVLMIIKPTSAIFNPYSLFVLLACFLWAATIIFTKKLTKIQHPFVIVFYSNLTAFFIALPFSIANWVWVDVKITAILACVAVMAILSNTLVTKAYKLTDVTNVMPFDYNRLLFSTLLGFVVFGEVIDLQTYVGAAIIFGATMYLTVMFSREKKAEQQLEVNEKAAKAI